MRILCVLCMKCERSVYVHVVCMSVCMYECAWFMSFMGVLYVECVTIWCMCAVSVMYWCCICRLCVVQRVYV